MSIDVPVLSHAYDLARTLTERARQFPRDLRQGLGRDIETCCRGIVADIVRCQFTPASPAKVDLLRRCTVELEVLRLHLRMACDLKALPFNVHEHLLRLAFDVGSQLGAWLKAISPNSPRGGR